ncbi:hypothetical protein NDU88_002494 [Pleurodeles waltl]|uniref:Uncharacterized protein n=1 Tax=Pleurodeles waltl TaxID=8319 RepID=A0AAV7VDV5_PLEWA|nr:hypothetical protein NDU88_002494 [Pleurodeles waltl]
MRAILRCTKEDDSAEEGSSEEKHTRSRRPGEPKEDDQGESAARGRCLEISELQFSSFEEGCPECSALTRESEVGVKETCLDVIPVEYEPPENTNSTSFSA